MTDIYVLVHGAWHTGADFEAVAKAMRRSGHVVHCPTLAGNAPGDDRASTGLGDAIDSVVRFIERHDLEAVRLVGHSYGGMVISGVADRIARRLRRLVYVNAFVPLDGECLNDMVPPHYRALFDDVAAANGNAVMLPFEIWRESFINDADFALARATYERLNPHPYRTFTDTLALSRPLAQLPLGKSYVNCLQDTGMPHSLPWHPRLSERLGLFRLIECPGSHELLFSGPERLAQAIVEAGRD
ncbi:MULTISPECIES: alpha/beta hydrolase [Ralstonia solanacearum species complex]|uniref:alpha/beta hydrolase n=1 Tax=Ralstonia solanacearum species complex TaxID=3116862 RepID=UPI00078EC1D8|nr:alpha/beta hydrolase [Ralstonia solanacearum]BEU72631.1 alpha/beta hydrolase [Ralstonia pseudosolanacearum]AMP38075.1 salicylate esterase [Ralstonia solanacearum]AXV77476.1 alpha/beta hydrolase [Ralstonia solanacearum]AXV86901.1 alpha/beta hydrolase [Ralstonia solanacearum]AXV91497.1 alpha/beta hydrolase [Ralstonia solanacearum]